MPADLENQLVIYGSWLEQQCATPLRPRAVLGSEHPTSFGDEQAALDMERKGAGERRPRRRMLLTAAAVGVLVVAGVVGLVAVNREPAVPTVPLNDSVAVIDPPGALFVLPAPVDDYQLANGNVSTSRPDPQAPAETFEPNGLLVGVVDADGYTALRSVSIYQASPIERGDWTQVDTPTGPAFTTSEPFVAVAQQRNREWLLIRTPTDEQSALELLNFVTVDDTGDIAVDAQAPGLVVIDEHPPPTDGVDHQTLFEATTPDGAATTVETATSATPMFPAASVADRIEPTQIDGAKAWIATRTDSDGEWNGLIWNATPNRVVAVSGHASIAEIRRLAESLEIVEQTTWQQALPGATVD
jgi:hypothetical protein